MNNPYTESEILAGVKDVLANVLGLRPDEIAEDKAIVDDLDADSLDFVDLNANLEKRFNFSLPKKHTLEQAGKISGHPEQFCGKHGLTDEGVRLLQHSLSRYHHLSPGMTVHDIFNATTITNVANLCYGLFNHLPHNCPECGHGVATISSATKKVVCAACSAGLRPLHGDTVQSLHVTEYLEQKKLETV